MDDKGEPMMIYCFVSICLASVIQTFCTTQTKPSAWNKRVKQILQSSFNLSNMTQVKWKAKTCYRQPFSVDDDDDDMKRK